MKPHNRALAAGGLPHLDYRTYQKIRAYCWQDLATYIDTPVRNSVLKLSAKLAGGQIGEIKHEQGCAIELYRCRDLTPQENSAAHLLAVISNHRAITWHREPHPPAGNEPASPLEQWQTEELARQTGDAVKQYAAYLPEREAAALLAVCTSAVAPAPAERNKPMLRSAAQDAAILEEIRHQGYDPRVLPKAPAGKRGVKADIRAACLDHKDTFQSDGVFDAAWQRLRDQSQISDSNPTA